MTERTYIAIDLKSFYASVECVERGLDPMENNLVVADTERTEKTICLAVSPALKSFGIPGRPRLFEVVSQVREINAARRRKASGHRFSGKSFVASELRANPALELDFITAMPQMAHYMAFSTHIYSIYMKYISPEDMHVYSIDEVFIDATPYLERYGCTARELAMHLILDVYSSTGITATAGIGSNLYLCKVALDIGAKHIDPDENGVRIAELDERSYRERLWAHRPLTDFWRVGKGTAAKLEANGMYTMGDVARCSIGSGTSLKNENLLYKLFGVNAELLIDHAWGVEPCTIAQIKAYRPASNSISTGQVLKSAYTNEKALIVVREMADAMSLTLVEKHLLTDQLVLTVGYDAENLTSKAVNMRYSSAVTYDAYGRPVPKHAHGTANLEQPCASTRRIVDAVTELYRRITDTSLTIRRITLCANRLTDETVQQPNQPEQLDLFTDYATLQAEHEAQEQENERERDMQHAILRLRHKYGKNAVLKAMSLEDGATAKERNAQIGGHRE